MKPPSIDFERIGVMKACPKGEGFIYFTLYQHRRTGDFFMQVEGSNLEITLFPGKPFFVRDDDCGGSISRKYLAIHERAGETNG